MPRVAGATGRGAGDAVVRPLSEIETDHDSGEGGDQEKKRRVDSDGLVRVEGNPEPGCLPVDGCAFAAPPQNQAGRDHQREDQAGKVDDGFTHGRKLRRGAGDGHQTQMKLMDVAQDEVAVHGALGLTQHDAVVRIYIDGGAVGELHQLHQILRAEKLHHRNTRAREPVLDDRNKIVFGQRMRAGRDKPQVRMEPMGDVSFKRHDSAGEAENREENRGDEPM